MDCKEGPNRGINLRNLVADRSHIYLAKAWPSEIPYPKAVHFKVSYFVNEVEGELTLVMIFDELINIV